MLMSWVRDFQRRDEGHVAKVKSFTRSELIAELFYRFKIGVKSFTRCELIVDLIYLFLRDLMIFYLFFRHLVSL